MPAEKLLVALFDQGNRLANEESHELAIVMFRHSVEIGRAVARTGQYGAELAVAAALNNMGSCLRKLEQLEQAEPAFREAAEIFERRWNQDAALIEYTYADVLEGQAAVLAQLGRFLEAIPVSTRLVTHSRIAAQSDSSRTVNLAKALRRFAWVRIPPSLDLDAALAAVNESITIFQRLAHYSADEMKDEMALTRNVLACVLDKVGRSKEAAHLREQHGIVGIPFELVVRPSTTKSS